MRKSTRDEIGKARDRLETRAERETNHDKWTNMLQTAVKRCGFRLVAENNGMMEIVDPDMGEIVAHAPKRVTSKKKLRCVLEDCGLHPHLYLN